MIWIIQATFVFTLIYGHLSSLTFPLQELQLGEDYRVGIKGAPDATEVDLPNISDGVQLTVYKGNEEVENIEEWFFGLSEHHMSDVVDLDTDTGEIVAVGNGIAEIGG